ncbi:hypothetical protein SKUL_58 [Pseudomonas phage Skulduggery]|uniref:Uncharacterized protein n=1 Tax=Pseudomonas phage Skulduggery TaxID=2006671 RepID=A0A1Y0T2R4_9CAUD|nr:hypothetical protein PP627_gp58 [Pseudomonas phage Skulduggery]ARV77157.1 hypothetical protein SKUL_58 [Pseudomonas phage Skulduggery]
MTTLNQPQLQQIGQLAEAAQRLQAVGGSGKVIEGLLEQISAITGKPETIESLKGNPELTRQETAGEPNLATDAGQISNKCDCPGCNEESGFNILIVGTGRPPELGRETLNALIRAIAEIHGLTVHQDETGAATLDAIRDALGYPKPNAEDSGSYQAFLEYRDALQLYSAAVAKQGKVEQELEGARSTGLKYNHEVQRRRHALDDVINGEQHEREARQAADRQAQDRG